MSQVSVGLQAGGRAYSQIIFFEDKQALDEFESGSFQFGADVSAIVITAAADASGGTTGVSAGASAGKLDATTDGDYQKAMAAFTVAKGGAMFDASLVGQKFTYRPTRATKSASQARHHDMRNDSLALHAFAAILTHSPVSARERTRLQEKEGMGRGNLGKATVVASSSLDPVLPRNQARLKKDGSEKSSA